MVRRARYRYPAGAHIRGRSVGGRFASVRQLQQFARLRYPAGTVIAGKSVGGQFLAGPEEAGAREWEIAVDYNARRATSNSRGVDVNLRIRRRDGRRFTFEEAYDVWSYLQYAHRIKAGYVLAGIDWRRPETASHRFRHALPSEIESALADLLGPLVNAPDLSARIHRGEFREKAHWRFGAVKEEE